MVIIPDIPNVEDYINPPQAVDSNSTITDVIIDFVINTFNMLLSVSRDVIAWITTDLTIGPYTASPIEFMLGTFLPIFLAYSLAKWIADILT